MPKSTFYHISKEKQERIIHAARKEFLNVPYSEVSINRIIKEAEIPRGSFYQYFEGKEDLFHLVLQDGKNYLLEILTEGLESARGDIFKALESHLDRIVTFIYHDKSGKNQMLFSEPWIFETVWMGIMMNETDKADNPCRLADKIDATLLDVEGEEELLTLVNILGVVVRDSVGKMFLYRDRLEEDKARKMIHARVDTLKRHYSKK